MKVELHEHAPKEDERRCPFCHDALLAEEETWPCPSCGTVHHLECAHENRKCAELGCGGTLEHGTPPPRVRRIRPRALHHQTGPAPSRLPVATWPRALALWAVMLVVLAVTAPKEVAIFLGVPWVIALLATIAGRIEDWVTRRPDAR